MGSYQKIFGEAVDVAMLVLIGAVCIACLIAMSRQLRLSPWTSAAYQRVIDGARERAQ